MKRLITRILQNETVPAVGCTEPASMALLAARLRKHLPGTIQWIRTSLSPNIYKNAKAVGIPGIKRKGLSIPIFLGVSMKRPVYNLEILSSLCDEDREEALSLLERVPIDISIDYSRTGVFLEMEMETTRGRILGQVMENHAELVFLQSDDTVLIDRREEFVSKKKENPLLAYSIKELVHGLLSINPQDLGFLLKGLELNMEMAKAGLTMEEGLSIGPKWKRLIEKGLIENDLSNRIAWYTSAACDARMSGVKLPVMTLSGSGNHGLIAFIPIALLSQEISSTDEELVQALGLSCLLTIYIKQHTGRLSSTCGCGIAAGVGASAGLTHLLGSKKIEEACTIVISSLAGMVCDGGKVSCALKLCTSATMAHRAALLASVGMRVPSDNGIVAQDLPETICNLGTISNQGMKEMERAIISIL